MFINKESNLPVKELEISTNKHNERIFSKSTVRLHGIVPG